MNRVVLLLAMLGLGGCATTQAVVTPTIPLSSTQRVEEQPLPEHPDAAQLPPEIPPGEWIAQLEGGACVMGKNDPCPEDTGMVTSEARAFRDGLYRLRYKELRVYYEADRKVWTAQRALYEGRLNDANTALKQAQPTWFERHALEIGILSGFVVGAGATIGIVYGLAPAVQP